MKANRMSPYPWSVAIVACMLLVIPVACDFDASVSFTEKRGDYDLPADAETDPAETETETPEIEPEPQCSSDEDCNQPWELCIKGICVPRFPDCYYDEDCPEGQYCEEDTQTCVDWPVDGDTDDADNTDPDNVDPWDPDWPDTDPDWPDTDPDRDNGDRDRDDTADPDPADRDDQPVIDCTSTGCLPEQGVCNPVTGNCEWCDPPCETGESCNYTGTLWYCGNPCIPPCPDGFACSGGTCIELRCPRCEPCYTCSALSGYICAFDPTDPRCVDGDSTWNEPQTPDMMNGKKARPAYTCQPAASPCIEGLANCCSGACVMGYCL